MPQCQMDALLAIRHDLPSIANSLAEIAKQFKIANQLNVLKMKAIYDGKISPEMIDSICDGN